MDLANKVHFFYGCWIGRVFPLKLGVWEKIVWSGFWLQRLLRDVFNQQMGCVHPVDDFANDVVVRSDSDPSIQLLYDDHCPNPHHWSQSQSPTTLSIVQGFQVHTSHYRHRRFLGSRWSSQVHTSSNRWWRCSIKIIFVTPNLKIILFKLK